MSLIDEITELASELDEARQADVLEYIKSVKDMRSYPRVNRALVVDVLINDRVVQSNARNISASGVLINAKIKEGPGIPARVVFSVPGQHTPFKLNGKVVRVASGEVAICFHEMTDYARQTLHELLGR